MPKVHVDDINLYYELIEKSFPFFFIHGLESSSRDWEKQVAFFHEKYKILYIDVRGHDRSDKPGGCFSIDFCAGHVRIDEEP